MIGWILLAILVGLITLIMLVPIGADLRYEDEVIRVSAKVAGIKIQLIPKKKKELKTVSIKINPVVCVRLLGILFFSFLIWCYSKCI